MALADYQALVDDLTRDDTGQIVTADRDEAIARAVSRYSQDRPRLKKQDITADAQQKLSLPSGWEAGFSELRSIEHPLGSVPPLFLDQDRYALYDDGTNVKLMLIDAVNVGETLRVEYTIAHVLNGSTDTLPAIHREAVAKWAAALLLDQLAARYAGTSDSTLQADAVEHGSKSRDYAARAASLRKQYLNEIGVEDRRNVAHGAVVNLDQADSRGQDRLTHPRRFR